MTIKPEDIPDDVIDRLIHQPAILGIRENIARVANLLIEAGVVSPPCWEVFGEVFGETIITPSVFKRREDAEKWTEVDSGFRKVRMRHWKGQTE